MPLEDGNNGSYLVELVPSAVHQLFESAIAVSAQRHLARYDNTTLLTRVGAGSNDVV